MLYILMLRLKLSTPMRNSMDYLGNSNFITIINLCYFIPYIKIFRVILTSIFNYNTQILNIINIVYDPENCLFF